MPPPEVTENGAAVKQRTVPLLHRVRKAQGVLNSLIRSFSTRHAGNDVTVLAMHPGVVRISMGGPTVPLGIETSATISNVPTVSGIAGNRPPEGPT